MPEPQSKIGEAAVKVTRAARHVDWKDTAVMFLAYSAIVLGFANKINGDEAAQIALGAAIAGFIQIARIRQAMHKAASEA